MIESIRTRPRIKLTPTPTQVGLSVFTAIGVIAVWVICALYYDKLPETIPTHFGITGAPDASGPKSALYVSPILATVMYLLLTGIMRVPFVYNYPVPITEENAARQYGNAVATFYWLRAGVVWMIVYGEWMMVQTALGKANGMALMSAFPLAMVGMLICYVIRAYRDR